MLDVIMNALKDVPADKMQEIMEKGKSNPMEALSLIQEYLSPEAIQQLMMAFMQNPGAFTDMAAQAGVSEEQIAEMKKQMVGE